MLPIPKHVEESVFAVAKIPIFDSAKTVPISNSRRVFSESDLGLSALANSRFFNMVGYIPKHVEESVFAFAKDGIFDSVKSAPILNSRLDFPESNLPPLALANSRFFSVFGYIPKHVEESVFALAETPIFDPEKTAPISNSGLVFSESNLGLSALANSRFFNMFGYNLKKVLWCALLFVSSLTCAEEGVQIESRTIKAVGTVFPQYKSTLGSVVAGKVDQIFVDVGDSVKKGQPLLCLDQSFFVIAVEEGKAAVRSAKVELEDAARNFERMKKLFEKPEGEVPSISQKRFEDAKTRYEQAEVGLQRSEEGLKRAQTNLAESTIAAPYDGVVTKRLVHPGEPVNATPVTKLLELVSIDDLYVEFSIPQLHASELKVGTPVQLSIEGTHLDRLLTTISRIYPDIDEKTRSVKCRAAIKNVDRAVHPGALVHICIPLTETSHDSL